MRHDLERESGGLPSFNSRGQLPHGIHRAAWEEFIRRFVYNERREELFEGLIRAAAYLSAAGCTTLYVGGSYVTKKQEPDDIDVVWKSEEVDWRLLRYIAPVFFEMKPGSPRQKRLFGGEFFPSEGVETLSGKTFLEFFRRDRRGNRRGLVALDITRFGKGE